MNITIVTAAVIFQDNKILLTQRKSGTNQELKWEFPGGKLEEDESPDTCLIREIKEELNLDILVEDIYDVVFYQYHDITILLLAYKCKIVGGNIIALDCNSYEWVALDNISSFNLSKADIPIVNKILNIN